MVEDMQVRNFSGHTKATYLRQVSLFARHFGRSPAELGPDHIRAYQLYLTNERRLSTSTVVSAVSALRFFYKVTLKKDWPVEEMIPSPKMPRKLPVVLSPEEVLRFLDAVKAPKHRAILTTCYAAGLRISEACRITVSDVDSQRMVLRIEQGNQRHRTWEQIERTGGRADFHRGDPEISRRGLETAMAEQQLNRADVGAGFQQMDRERVRSECGLTGLDSPDRQCATWHARATVPVVMGT